MAEATEARSSGGLPFQRHRFARIVAAGGLGMFTTETQRHGGTILRVMGASAASVRFRLPAKGVAEFAEPLANAWLGMAPLCLPEPTEPRPRGSGRSAEYCNSLS